MNSTETPGGSGIPAGWYDDPSGEGLRWWDGEQWTEHVHTAESAAAASSAGGAGAEREAPPPELVGLREKIRSRGAKGVGLILGGVVLVIVAVALLLSGGSSNNGGNAGNPSGGANAAKQAQIKAIDKQLKNKKLPKAERKALEKEKKQLQGKSGGKSGEKKGNAGKKKSPGEEGN